MVSAMLLGVGQEEERGAQRSLAPRTSTSRGPFPSAGVPPASPGGFQLALAVRPQADAVPLQASACTGEGRTGPSSGQFC